MGFMIGVLVFVFICTVVHLMYRPERTEVVPGPDLESADGFVATQQVDGSDGVTGIAIDEAHKKLRLISYHRAGAAGIDQGGAFGAEEGHGFGPDQDWVHSVDVGYGDILSAEVLDDFALAGDRIVLAIMRVQLRISLKNTSIPTHSLVFLESTFHANRALYEAALHKARHWLGVLEAAIYEDGRPGAPSPAGGPSAPSSVLSVADELRKLAQLRDEGVLTEMEFQQQKARLLA